jgi:tRNA pseudouridine synthase 10
LVARFSLCAKCASRQGEGNEFEATDSRGCFICQGLTARTGALGQKVIRGALKYDFRTFSVGMIILPEVQEREDQVRSELQIRGGETIKSQMSREIASIVSKKTYRKVDRGHPELTVLVDLRSDSLSMTSKSLFLYGRYSKPRGVSQRREICENCGGRRCDECEQGYSRIPSMEVVLGGKLVRILGASDVKFTWFGSEDPDSIVYPPGRPFVAEVRNPRKRRAPRSVRLLTGRGLAGTAGMKVLKGRPKVVPSFIFKTRAVIEPLEGFPVDLAAARKIGGALVDYRNNKGKTVVKKVYSVLVKRKGKLLIAEMKLDGGLPVKRLVSGESTSPSLSEVLKTPLKCQRFDILRVWESGSLEFGKI